MALDASGFAERFLGPDRDDVKVRTRAALWVGLLALPFRLATVPLVVWLVSGTRPYQLGLTLHRFGRNVLLGIIGWVVCTPVAYGVLYGLVLLTKPAEEHPATRLARDHPLPLEMALNIFAAVAAAPVLEELLFRGLLQPWVRKRPWGGYVTVAAALGTALALRASKMQEAWETHGSAGVLEQLWPAAFVLAMAPGYFVLRRLEREPAAVDPHFWSSHVPPIKSSTSSVAAAVYATSLLFAALHSAVWPTPIPLFILSVGLGFLAARTQSLVAPIMLHALFNCVASVMLLHKPVPLPENLKPTTSAVSPAPAALNSTTVPACWLPTRR